MDPSATEEIQEAAFDFAALLLGVGVGIALGIVAAVLALAIIRFLLRRSAPGRLLVRRARRAGVVTAGILGARRGIAVTIGSDGHPGWLSVVNQVLEIGVILALTWLAISLISGIKQAVFEAHGAGGVERGSRVRRLQTQVQMLNRVAIAVALVLGVAAVLLTFPSARTIGTSILASAGIASVVVGLAAQSILGDLFAGLQIAFTDSIRIDDNVRVEMEFGYVEEITLTYVVVRLWDERRMVLPSSYFTKNPFINFTKTDPSMTGVVEIDVDWSIPVPAARAELQRLVATCPDWDGRAAKLEVTDATLGMVRLRIVVTAADNGKVWNVRTHVREGMVEWLQRSAPYAIYKQHMVDHKPPAAWETIQPVIESDVTDSAEADMRELIDAVKAERREITFERDMRLAVDGGGQKPGETARLTARSARRRAFKKDRRRAREKAGALGLADETQWMATPSTDTTRLIGTTSAAIETDGKEPNLEGVPYGAVPRERNVNYRGSAGAPEGGKPGRRSVRHRLAAMGCDAREAANPATAAPADAGGGPSDAQDTETMKQGE